MKHPDILPPQNNEIRTGMVYAQCCTYNTGKLVPAKDCVKIQPVKLPAWENRGGTYQAREYAHEYGKCTVRVG